MDVINKDLDTKDSYYSFTHPAGLAAGQVCDEHFWLLAELSPVHSEKALMALRDYFVFGYSRREICTRHGISQSYLGVAIRRIVHVNKIVKIITQFYK